MVCLSLSLSATRELKVDLSVAWTGEKEMQKTEKRGRRQVECRHEKYFTIQKQTHAHLFLSNQQTLVEGLTVVGQPAEVLL